MLYLFDTNIILAYFREDNLYEYVQTNYNPFGKDNLAVISVVSLGEIFSLALRNQWGEPRKQKLQQALAEFTIIDIHAQDIIQQYAYIEAYSQSKLPTKPLPKGISARNMGKNDLWIAATASVIEATLISTDEDFLHLPSEILNFNWVDFKKL